MPRACNVHMTIACTRRSAERRVDARRQSRGGPIRPFRRRRAREPRWFGSRARKTNESRVFDGIEGRRVDGVDVIRKLRKSIRFSHQVFVIVVALVDEWLARVVVDIVVVRQLALDPANERVGVGKSSPVFVAFAVVSVRQALRAHDGRPRALGHDHFRVRRELCQLIPQRHLFVGVRVIDPTDASRVSAAVSAARAAASSSAQSDPHAHQPQHHEQRQRGKNHQRRPVRGSLDRRRRRRRRRRRVGRRVGRPRARRRRHRDRRARARRVGLRARARRAHARRITLRARATATARGRAAMCRTSRRIVVVVRSRMATLEAFNAAAEAIKAVTEVRRRRATRTRRDARRDARRERDD